MVQAPRIPVNLSHTSVVIDQVVHLERAGRHLWCVAEFPGPEIDLAERELFFSAETDSDRDGGDLLVTGVGLVEETTSPLPRPVVVAGNGVTLDQFLSRLEGVRRAGAGWSAKCPAHEDRHPSLSITAGDDRLLLHCHAGCSGENVLHALGLGWSDLFYERVTNGPAEFVATCDYWDEGGHKMLFQVCRTPDKRFLQRRPVDRSV
jgi:hypothetical protein